MSVLKLVFKELEEVTSDAHILDLVQKAKEVAGQMKEDDKKDSTRHEETLQTEEEDDVKSSKSVSSQKSDSKIKEESK